MRLKIMLPSVPLLRSVLVAGLGVVILLIGAAGYLLLGEETVFDADIQPSPTATPSTVVLQDNDYDLVNAPAEIQACVKAIIGEEAFAKLVARSRPPNQGENEAISHCFQSPSPNEASQSLATAPPAASPRASPAASQLTTPTSASTRPPASPSRPAPAPSPTVDIHSEVWTKNGYDGASYEYKVNCGSNYATLEECFLWDLTRVAVTAPSGQVYELAKDFNINSYSGEVTRRWVLYGPAGGGLPAAGNYTFTYQRNQETLLTQTVVYTPEVVDPPSNVTYVRDGDDLRISWQAPAGISSRMWYKPSVDPPGNDRQIISLVIGWDQTSATLADVPVGPGEQIEINVAVFFPGGYAYPAPLVITW
jgi:hypothetical protein